MFTSHGQTVGMGLIVSFSTLDNTSIFFFISAIQHKQLTDKKSQ